METKKPLRASAMVVLAMGLLGLLAACGADATPTPMPKPTSTPVPAEAEAAPAATPTPDEYAAWNELVAKAQEEGEVVIIASTGLPVADGKTMDYFEEKFGINVVLMTGSGGSNSNRVLAERSQGMYSADIISHGTSTTERFRAAGALEPAAEWIIHPQITEEARKDPTQWYFDSTIWIDRDNKYAMADVFNIQPVMGIWYSTDPSRVSEAELDSITSYYDLLRPEFKGRIGGLALNDERIGTGVVRGIIALGQEFVDKLHTDVDLQLVGGESDGDLVAGLLRGKWDFAVFGGRDDAEAAMELGLPLSNMSYTRPMMEEGEMVTFGAEIRASLVNRAAHPNAAAVFYNWIRTQEGQAKGIELRQNDPDPSVSLRADVPQLTVSDEKWAKAKQLLEWSNAGVLEENMNVILQDEKFFEMKTQLWKEYNENYKAWGYDSWVLY